MSKRIWHSGPPPHVGWWNASRCKYHDDWRWWDGIYWSVSINKNKDSEFAGKLSEYCVIMQSEINWTIFYPKNARVPRIDPRSKS